MSSSKAFDLQVTPWVFYVDNAPYGTERFSGSSAPRQVLIWKTTAHYRPVQTRLHPVSSAVHSFLASDLWALRSWDLFR